MICVKKHETPEGHLLLAACDLDIVDKSFEEGDIELKCPTAFYKDEEVDEHTFNTLLEQATYANLVGKQVIELAQKNTSLQLQSIKTIQGIPYAYIVKTPVENL